MRIRSKCCGITNSDDCSAAIVAGFDCIGLNVAKGPRKISVEQAKLLRDQIPPLVSVVALFVNADEETVLETMALTRCDVVQLHGDESAEFVETIQKYYPVIRAFRIATEEDIITAQQSPADLVLLDAAVPGIEGGSGHAWDHDLLGAIDFGRPYMLAGGLHAENVQAACELLQPYAVDVSSGVEAEPGRKDHNKLRAFIQAIP